MPVLTEAEWRDRIHHGMDESGRFAHLGYHQDGGCGGDVQYYPAVRGRPSLDCYCNKCEREVPIEQVVTDEDDLILADGLAVLDPDSRCMVPGCHQPPEVLIGPNEDLEICAGHAALLVEQASQIIEVKEALAKRLATCPPG